jgi:hypothetical protein
VQVILRIVVGILLIAHGLVHLLYFVTNPDPDFPFTVATSRLLPEALRRPVAVGLATVTILGFALLGLAVGGAPGLNATWPILAVVAGAASLTMLITFWSPQLIAGIIIDVALIAFALTRPGWVTHVIG